LDAAELAGSGSTVWDVSHRLFGERDAGNLFLALRESFGHLDMLCDQGQAVTRQAGEILIYQAA